MISNENLGQNIRTIISQIELQPDEELKKVLLIIIPTVSKNNVEYTKLGKGIELEKYATPDEKINIKW